MILNSKLLVKKHNTLMLQSQPFTTISIKTSFQESIGPGKHQCKQSLTTFASLPSPADDRETLNAPGCPSGLNNDIGFTSKTLSFTPFSRATTYALPNSSISISRRILSNQLSPNSPSLTGPFLSHTPPSYHSAPSKWLGLVVL